jgi:hypothetical protein
MPGHNRFFSKLFRRKFKGDRTERASGVPPPLFPVACAVTHVLRVGDAPDGREVLVILNINFFVDDCEQINAQEFDELDFWLSFISENEERKEAEKDRVGQQTELKIVKVGLFRPTKSAKDIHEPLPTTDAAYKP